MAPRVRYPKASSCSARPADARIARVSRRPPAVESDPSVVELELLGLTHAFAHRSQRCADAAYWKSGHWLLAQAMRSAER
jgi:hypothetical protein